MAEKNEKIIYDGQNRCRRCNRPLSDPDDLYGWRCAQIVGLNNYQRIASNLDEAVLDGYNRYVLSYLNSNALNKSKGISNTDIDRFGVGSKVHTALVVLREAYDMFPEYEHAIAEVENEILWIGNEWGSENIEEKINDLLSFLDESNSLFKGKLNITNVSLSTVEQVLAVAYPKQAAYFNEARIMADMNTWMLYNQKGDGDDEANAFKHIYWSAYATNKVGEKYTKLFTFAYEFGWHKENENDLEALKMDLHNNQRGRVIGKKYSIFKLKKAVLDDIASGNTAVIRNGKSVLNTSKR